MRIFNLVQLANKTEGICQKCIHFENDPAVIEKTYPGLTSMSSGYASVRGRDGNCLNHNLYLSENDSCASFTLQNFNQISNNRQSNDAADS